MFQVRIEFDMFQILEEATRKVKYYYEHNKNKLELQKT